MSPDEPGHQVYETLAEGRSKVLGVPAADPGDAVDHFYRTRLRCETDAFDVHHDLTAGIDGFVVLDVRRTESYADEHVAGAHHFSHHDMTAESVGRLDTAPLYVTYGWGPGCNAGAKGAAKLAAHGLRVKEMVGGLEYWNRQGFPVAAGLPASEGRRS